MARLWLTFVCLLFFSLSCCFAAAEDEAPLPTEDDALMGGSEESASNTTDYQEEDWGDGLKVLVTYRPKNCEHRAKTDDVIHYHYVGRLGSNGKEFGKSFDYNTPYIVSLGHGRIIAGMDRGLMGTCLWERRRITIPPHLGYGARGVGDSIPPNAVLVFYIRMIKIERNGHALGEASKFEDIWQTGLYSYTDQKWNETIDMMEEAIRLFNIYDNQTFHCLKECDTAVDLTASQQEIVDNYAGGDDPLINQFTLYVAKGKCIRDCKSRTLPPHMRYPDPAIVKDFRRRKPFSYLHFAYYQLKIYEEAAKCCFTFYHYNPTNELAINSIAFYRHELGLEDNQFVSREPIVSPNQAAFVAGRRAYNKELWLEATDYFEKCLTLYKEELSDCRLLCEDVLSVNLTQPDMNEQKRALFEEHDLVPDTMEYYQLLSTIATEVLTCRVGCADAVATIEGQLTENYLTLVLNYLQFSYYKLGQFKKAAENAATFIAIDPSDLVMTRNIHHYKSQHKLPNELFVPRKDFVRLHKTWETEKRLIHYTKFGEVKKRSGQRGDKAEIEVPVRHSEL